jgi:hypothetical protein
MKYYLLIVSLMACMTSVLQGQTHKAQHFKIERTRTVDPLFVEPAFHAEIKHVEAPSPDGDSYRSFLLRQKQASLEHYKQKKTVVEQNIPQKSNIEPIVGSGFIPTRYSVNGLPFTINAGIPSDNTLAVSDSGIVLLAMNSVLYGHDLNKDTAIFDNYRIFLRDLVGGISSSFYYDPKLFYDPVADRFILALLKDFSPSDSEVIIAFSSSNDPTDPWHIYELPGNPLNNNRWTDFPAIAVTEDKLYFTANLIIPDVSWQVGFDGSIIWEIDKYAGFAGTNDLDAVLYSEITYNGAFIRNLHPVQGAGGIADELILLSNRNFDIENDSIFFVRLDDENISVQALVTDLSYGVPPNARQADTDLTDPTEGLQTNDARVLGAIKFDDQIQFVANTMNPSTGFSAVYHGIIDLTSEDPIVSGVIISDSIKDYAYPNIAWSGNETCDRETIIGFLYSSFTDYPGVAAIYYNNDGNYSTVKTIQEGLNIVNRLPGGYERWGDYFGMQRQYNASGTVHSFGYLPMSNSNNSGYYAPLFSPDTSTFHISFDVQQPVSFCDNTIQLNFQNAVEPIEFSYSISNGSTGNQTLIEQICTGDTIWVTATDGRGCEREQLFILPKVILEEGLHVFPNPNYGAVIVQFHLENDGVIRFDLYDNNGRLVHKITEQTAKSGFNELSFSLDPLSAGLYTLVLVESNQKTQTFKILKGQ